MLSKEAFDFIKNNLDQDIRSLALKSHRFDKKTMAFLLTQIKVRQKIQHKLPTFHNNPQLLFPSELSSEQCSAEKVAEYKSSLFSGRSFIDLSGGLGVDSLFFSKKFDNVTLCEWNSDFHSVLVHNLKTLGVENIELFSGDGLKYLNSSVEDFDLIYLDPDRRHDGKREYDFESCEPNVLENLELLLSKSKRVLIKSSPMLDISLGIKQLKYVSKVWVISLKNECKEILFLLEKDKTESIRIKAVELSTEDEIEGDWEGDFRKSIFHSAKKYLYDPWVSIRKGNLQREICEKFNLLPSSASGLLTSDEKIEGFPGRVFQVLESFPIMSKEFKIRKINRANFITRLNHLDANTLHQQLKVKAGGEDFFILDSKIKCLIHTKKC